ncbi:hypothetical protein [Nocardioides daeguensis]|uniref:N-acetyltransferase n=1 Tax=Nocardioides daeguensis TaxID=908359 RepID=A0ABP6W0J4_9ACTN|nr:hypothetical protein [Nocardioides daeguensis]MBV6726584.1 hypothetical protein [Nocardioides daeguensis]MCR1774664.1 hypothetical protein [Nocardioides daeguensis]
MIRERRHQDLDRLAAVLLDVPGAAEVLAGRTPLAWLTEHDDSADVSWVFDQAPVTATPTRNVVGHVQFYAPPAAPWAAAVATDAGVDTAKLLVIGRFFVRPMKHDQNIARYLLKECVRRIAARGSVAVFDPDGLDLVPHVLWRRARFADHPPAPRLLP